jgi:ATP-dependent Clp protease ATP-binding subunit ClpA
VSTSVDLPLSSEVKEVLQRSTEAADRLGHKQIDCGHIVLGLIQESATIREWLSKYNIGPAAIDGLLEGPKVKSQPDDPHSLRLVSIIETGRNQLSRFSEAESMATVGKKRWTRKEALGHLIDCATAHHHWIARALTEQNPIVSGYPHDEWARVMK